MTVSLLEVLAAARAHAAPLAAESAGYLLLAVADHVVSSPRALSADEVELMPDGSVRLRPRRGAAPADENCERAVRALLARLLEVSSSVGPALRRAAERRDDVGLTALVRELENALIPVNRSAAKRALTRAHREVARARDAGKLEAWLKPEIAAEPAAPRVAAPATRSSEPVAAPVASEPLAVEAIDVAADFPEASPVQMPLVVAVPTPAPARVVRQAPPVELTLTPEPRLAVGEPAFTKPEPVVLRAKERGSSTPRLGTLVTAQTLPGEEAELTERAPAVDEETDSPDLSIDVDVDVEVDLEAEASEADTPVAVAAATPQPLVDPEPSCMPDVLAAMAELHTGIDADEAPTRIRDVVTELYVSEPVVREAEPPAAPPPALTPEPQIVDDAWLTQSSLEGVVVEPKIFESEQVDPALHDAVTWNPGPVAPAPVAPVLVTSVATEPVAEEPSPHPSHRRTPRRSCPRARATSRTCSTRFTFPAPPKSVSCAPP